MLLTETYFTERDYIKIPNYSDYHTTHPIGIAHRGTAILIKNKIKHYQTTPFREDQIQATSVVVEDRISPFTVTAVYCRPKHRIKKEYFINFFKPLGKRFIAGGDFNAKHVHWGSRLILPRGHELFGVAETLGLNVISSGHPTYWPTDRTKIPDLIDFYITEGISNNYVKCEGV